MEQGQKDFEDIREKKVVFINSNRSFYKGVVTGIVSTGAVLVILALAASFWVHGRISTGDGYEGVSVNLVDNSVRSKVNDLSSLIKAYYYEDVDEQTLTEGMYKGLFASLGDPYSAYYTEEEYEEMLISANAQYNGIGTVLQQDPDTMQVEIVKVYDSTPAQEAGLKAGDEVVSVEEIDARSMELSELVTHIRGKENSKVSLVITREGEFEKRSFKVRRAKVDVPTVEGMMLVDDIGLVVINEFGKATAASFIETMEKLQSEGMEKVIIDLRDNPGGMLTSVTAVLDYILPEGLIVYMEDKYGNRQEERSDAQQYLDMPLAVLINGNSASCSEVFAGAVRDYDYGILIGTTTFGKGVVQTVRPLSDNSAIKLTTAKYFTPKGENIHGKGIAPDIEVKYKYTGEKDAGTYDYMKDSQVKRAVRELKKQ